MSKSLNSKRNRVISTQPSNKIFLNSEVSSDHFAFYVFVENPVKPIRMPSGSSHEVNMAQAKNKLDKMMQYVNVGMDTCIYVAEDVCGTYKGTSIILHKEASPIRGGWGGGELKNVAI